MKLVSCCIERKIQVSGQTLRSLANFYIELQQFCEKARLRQSHGSGKLVFGSSRTKAICCTFPQAPQARAKKIWVIFVMFIWKSCGRNCFSRNKQFPSVSRATQCFVRQFEVSENVVIDQKALLQIFAKKKKQNIGLKIAPLKQTQKIDSHQSHWLVNACIVAPPIGESIIFLRFYARNFSNFLHDGVISKAIPSR